MRTNLLVKALLVALSLPIVVVATTMQTTSAQQGAYHFTVFVSGHRFGADAVNVRVQTSNGFDKTYRIATNTPNPGVTFYIPPNEGDSIQVCISDEIVGQILGGGNCQTYDVTGSDMSVTQEAG